MSMDFNSSTHSYRHHNCEHSSSLTRFRSAPCSLFPSSPENEHVEHVLGFHDFEDKPAVPKATESVGVGYQIFGLPPLYPRQSDSDSSSSTANGFVFLDTLGNSSLSRPNISPAGLFGSQNGPNAASGDLTPPSKRLLSFSSIMSSSLGLSSQNHVGGRGGASNHEDTPNVGGIGVPLGSMDKLLLYQDSIPCKVRAKRGCATHPRSIAERVRRTRISERIRKLQEIVPALDKQTNIADMLDFAVEHIKDLQRQLKILNDNRSNCKCISEKKPALLHDS